MSPLFANMARTLLRRKGFPGSPIPNITQKALFRTSPQRRLHPILYALVKPASRVASILAGRAARMWWARIGSERREAIRQRIRQNTHVLVGGGAGVVVLALYAYESHVVVCPYTGRKKFVALTPQQGSISIDFSFRTFSIEQSCHVLRPYWASQ